MCDTPSAVAKDLENEETGDEKWAMEKFKLSSGTPDGSDDEGPGEKQFGIFFPNVFMWFEVLFASDVVSDHLFVPRVFSSHRQEDRLNKRSNN